MRGQGPRSTGLRILRPGFCFPSLESLPTPSSENRRQDRPRRGCRGTAQGLVRGERFRSSHRIIQSAAHAGPPGSTDPAARNKIVGCGPLLRGCRDSVQGDRVGVSRRWGPGKAALRGDVPAAGSWRRGPSREEMEKGHSPWEAAATWLGAEPGCRSLPPQPLAPASVAHPDWKALLALSGPSHPREGTAVSRGWLPASPHRCPRQGAAAACQGCSSPRVPQGRESCDSCLRFQMDPLMNINRAW